MGAEGGGGGGGEEVENLEYTPTWVVASVCAVIIAISLVAERFLHFAGKYLVNKNQRYLFQALQKVKEAMVPVSVTMVRFSPKLMLLGFISLLLTVFQRSIVKICVPPHIMKHFLPCHFPKEASSSVGHASHNNQETVHHHRLLQAEESGPEYCRKWNKVPIISLESLHHLHIFIFVLAVVQVAFSALTIVLGIAQIRQWKNWEDSIKRDYYSGPQETLPHITLVREHEFIKNRFLGMGKGSTFLGWLQSFFKQFYGSLTRSDYHALRLGFVTTHCRGNPKFNFHKYMIRALEHDFKNIVGIRWYLWGFVILFLLLNIDGWHTYFWMSFIPFILVIAVGTKLEHIIAQLAHGIAEKHDAIEGDLIVKPSNDHFWFGRPRIILRLIQLILFQNAFEMAFFFWILVQFGLRSCYMGRVKFVAPRLLIGAFVQLLCSYSTLPLYAIVTQMGTYFNKSMFDENVQVGLIDWARKAKKRRQEQKNDGGRATQANSSSGDTLPHNQLGIIIDHRT